MYIMTNVKIFLLIWFFSRFKKNITYQSKFSKLYLQVVFTKVVYRGTYFKRRRSNVTFLDFIALYRTVTKLFK